MLNLGQDLHLLLQHSGILEGSEAAMPNYTTETPKRHPKRHPKLKSPYKILFYKGFNPKVVNPAGKISNPLIQDLQILSNLKTYLTTV
jgi:hypothetical protein